VAGVDLGRRPAGDNDLIISTGQFPEACFVPWGFGYPVACCGVVHCGRSPGLKVLPEAEDPAAGVLSGKSLPAGNEQMEQDRTAVVCFYQPILAE
jgi:hypothetical protein